MVYERLYWDYVKTRIKRINLVIDENESLSFLRLILSTVYGLEPGEIDEHITEGTEDMGADAIYFDIDEDDKRFDLHIVQSKYNKQSCENGIFNQNLPEEVINKFKNLFEFFSCNQEYSGVNQEVKAKKEEYDDLISRGYGLDKIIFTSGNLGIQPAEGTMGIFKRWLDNNPLRDKIEYRHYGLKEIFKGLETIETPEVSDAIKLSGRWFEHITSDIKGIVGTVSAHELLRLFERFGNKLFQQNVRYYLGDNKVNTKIIQSASETNTKDKFWFLNNGITIVCGDYEFADISQESPTLKITDFQIANGTQTTRAISKVFESGKDLEGIYILLKINKVKKELVELITESTNNQNPIKKRDLRSNDEIQKLLESLLLPKGYYFQRKRNQFVEKPKDKIIDNLVFAQLYHSFYLEKPHEARNQVGKLFSEEEKYSKIFNANLTANQVIFLHKIYQIVSSGIRKIKKERLTNIPPEILIRSKLFVLYGLRVYLDKKEIDIYDDLFLDNGIIDDLNEELIKGFLIRINEVINELRASEGDNIVKIFQKEEIVTKIKEGILGESAPPA